MYFGHQFLLQPHTLGGIFYSPKMLYLRIHGIGLSTCTIFQINVEDISLKSHFLEHVCNLLHYFPRTYSSCILDIPRTYVSCTLNISCLPPKVSRNSVEFMDYQGFLNQFTHYILSQNRITILLSYKRRSWGPIPTSSIRTEKLCKNPFPF
jgi:hypothetical protein